MVFLLCRDQGICEIDKEKKTSDVNTSDWYYVYFTITNASPDSSISSIHTYMVISVMCYICLVKSVPVNTFFR